MILNNTNRFYFIIILALVIAGCKGKIDTGTVGEPYSFTVESADQTSDTEFKWTILDQPLSSILSQNDLKFSANNQKMTFTPANKGVFSFQAITLQYGDTILIRNFAVEILEGTIDKTGEAANSNEFVEDESWLDEDPKTSEPVEEIVQVPIDEIEQIETKAITPKENIAEVVGKETPVPEKPVAKTIKQVATGPLPGSSIPIVNGRYTIQVSSWSDLEGAEKEYSQLVQEGFDAYVQRAFFKENNTTWFRVRVGSYGTYDQAAKVSKSISNILEVNAWVDFVRQDQ